MPGNIFFDISILFGITVAIAALVRFLRQPLIIAYIVAGIVAGPLFLNLVEHSEELFHAFAQLGVVLLLFVVGLSLNITHIQKIGKVVVTVGILQLLLTASLGCALLLGIGLSFSSALALGIASVFSSTVIIIKILGDKYALDSVYGRYTVGLLVIQDLIAVLLMIFLTTKTVGPVWEIVASLVGKGLVLTAVIYGLSQSVLPLFLRRIAHSPEFLFLFTITWCFGVATLVQWTGFSLEIGAVAAGISLGSSPYQLEIMSRIKPLRDFFIVVFFIILGSELELRNFGTSVIPSIILSLFVLLFNPLLLYALYRVHKFTRRNSFLASLSAAQVSEFGFILLFTARGLGYVSNSELTIFTLTALITIFLSSYLLTYNEQLYRWCAPLLNLRGKDSYLQTEDAPTTYDVWVVGYHRIGWKICQMLKKQHRWFAVIDHNPETIAVLRRHGIPAYFGDIGDVEFLDVLPFASAKLVILTVPDPEPQLTVIRYLKSKKSKALIIGNLHHSQHVPDLYHAGATFVMMPHLLGGDWITNILTEKPWTKHTFAGLKKNQAENLKQRYSAGIH